MDFDAIVNKLSGPTAPGDVAKISKTIAEQVAKEIQHGSLKIVDLIKGLNALLTNSNYDIRSKGVELLAQVVTALPRNQLSEKEVELLTEFICLRLIDHRSMEDAALRCLTYFVDCDQKPVKYNKKVMEFIKDKANVHKMDAKSRRKVYEMLKKFVLERKRMTNSMSGDYVYSLVTILEGENNPDNLMLCFGMMAFILKNFDDLEPYIDDIFEWLSSYYPVDYTPIIDRTKGSENSAAFVIHRSDLVEALYDCFYATDLNSDNLQTLLLEKVDSNILSSQLESLECLIKCYEKPFPLSSITKFNSTLWTAIRMNCLKKMESVEPKLLDASLRTLTALSKRLLEDKEMYLTFMTDMYDELAIAFRKPEMDLFEPAARLLTHSIIPSLKGFEFVLSKLLPLSLNALAANELRPISGLTYVVEKLHSTHPDSTLSSELDESLAKLAVKLASLHRETGCISLLEALLEHHITLDSSSLEIIVNTLQEQYKKSDLDVERSLALICSKYSQLNMITDASIEKYDLDTLLRLIYRFETTSLDLSKFSIYLRLLRMESTSSERTAIDALDQVVLSDSLAQLRSLLLGIKADGNMVEKSASIHAIILNKLDAKHANQICMSVFSSSYCQSLVPGPTSGHDSHTSRVIYLPHIKWIFKALVLRNHQLASPLINLILNCITSDKVDYNLALDATKIFGFVLSDDELFQSKNHCQVFTLFKQKFYMQTSKEIRLRLEQLQANPANAVKENLLVHAIASQLSHLPTAVFKRDQEWLARQLLRFLNPPVAGGTGEYEGKLSLDLLQETYKCFECLMSKDLCDGLVSFLSTIIDLNLKNAQEAKSVEIRRQALVCLSKVATSFKESDLLVYRAGTVDKLRNCLVDKKRLVREAAGEARLGWVLVGQPVGST